MKKRIWSALLAVCVAAGMLSGPVGARTVLAAEPGWAEQAGTEETDALPETAV